MQIPFVDLAAQRSAIKDELDNAIEQVLNDRTFIRGPHVETFEQEFASFCGVKECIGVGNGTDALFIALKTLGVGPGDEVIVPAMTFIASAEAVTMTGASPVFVDVDPESYTISPQKIGERISPKTKAIIPVHLYGHPADMPAIRDIAQEYDLKIVQDAAQAHGAKIQGKKIATFGDCTCFSFYPGKNLGAYGDAGAIVTDDEKTAKRIREFANHGRADKYKHKFEGVNSRMDGIQGAILSVKLNHLESWTLSRRHIASLYDQQLKNIDGITTPKCADNSWHVYHLYVIQTELRDNLRLYLTEQGIASGIHYPTALPFLEAYERKQHKPEDFPVAWELQYRILSLPMFPELGEERAMAVVQAISSWVNDVT
jgi:dTDP-4-amino-4,6-dideoxygalactose transaminase